MSIYAYLTVTNISKWYDVRDLMFRRIRRCMRDVSALERKVEKATTPEGAEYYRLRKVWCEKHLESLRNDLRDIERKIAKYKREEIFGKTNGAAKKTES